MSTDAREWLRIAAAWDETADPAAVDPIHEFAALPDASQQHVIRFVRALETASGAMTLREAEAQHILAVLSACDGNKALTARALGIDRRTLYRKLARGAL